MSVVQEDLLTTELAPKFVPLRALGLSLLTLFVPTLSSFLAPEWTTGDAGLLLWLTALIPAFLLAYYKGWQGVSVALALGMVMLTSVQIGLSLLGLSEPDWSLLLGVVIVYVGVSLCLGTFADLLHQARRDAERLALTDHLTALPNRRYAILVLERAYAAALRGAVQAPFCVALFDIDNFRDFNDRHGHAAGDAVLKGFAGILNRYTRKMDLSGRFGGEEFLSVLLSGGAEGALAFAERIRQSVKELELSSGPITVSCGVAAFSEQMGTIEELLTSADEALYAAKRGGRDRVVVSAGRLDPRTQSTSKRMGRRNLG